MITLSARLRRAFEPRFVRRVFRTALPIAAQFLIASAVNLIDVVMIGRLGGDAVAAAGGGNQIFFLLTMVLFGINSGGSVFLSQFWGTQDLKNVRRTMGMMYLLGAAVTLLFTVGALAAPRLLVSFYVHEEPALSLAADYLFWVGLSYPMTAVSLILSMVCRCTGSLHLPTLASTLSILVNVGGNALLIYGLLGCPALGLRGAAIATTLARLVECLVLVAAIYRRKLAGAARPKELFTLDGNFVRKYLRTAWPVLLNETLWSVGFSLYTVAYGLLGTAALAAVQISGTVIQLMTVFTRGMSNACGIFIGNMVGAGDEEGALGLRTPVRAAAAGGGAGDRAYMHRALAPVSPPVFRLRGDPFAGADHADPAGAFHAAEMQQHGAHRGRFPGGGRHAPRLSHRQRQRLAGGRSHGLSGRLAGPAGLGRFPDGLLRRHCEKHRQPDPSPPGKMDPQCFRPAAMTVSA